MKAEEPTAITSWYGSNVTFKKMNMVLNTHWRFVKIYQK